MPAHALKPASSNLVVLQDVYERFRNRFHNTHKEASSWLARKSLDVPSLRQTSQQVLAATTLASSVALGKPVDAAVMERLQMNQEQADSLVSQITLEEHEAILAKMKEVVQQPPGHLKREDELYLEQQLSDMLGFEVSAELEGNRLNHSIGVMGGEQHLRRFPTDSLDQHDAFLEAGIAPNRGAFGWFTENGELTSEAVQREKYYFAVQTLYLPDWNTRHKDLKPWYKFRKMVVINPAERIAVVGVVGDAGPALSVNKQYGGSPEVIREGKIWSKESRGRVMLLFINDPENKIPLGVINLDFQNTEQLAQITL